MIKKMVDYSKWDRMDYGDSSSDDDDEESNTPRVTSLDRPGRVIIGPGGSSLEVVDGGIGGGGPMSSTKSNSKSKSSSGGRVVGDDIASTTTVVDRRVDESSSSSTSKVDAWRVRATRNGGECRAAVVVVASSSSPIAETTSTAAHPRPPLYWSQDRNVVVLRMAYDSSKYTTKGLRVRVTGALDYVDRFSAVGGGDDDDGDGIPSHGTVEVIHIRAEDGRDCNGGETTLLRGRLPRPIHLNEDENEIDFEFEERPTSTVAVVGGGETFDRVVTIFLPKAVPMAGMTIWWDRPLVGYPSIDVSAICDRGGGGGRSGFVGDGGGEGGGRVGGGGRGGDADNDDVPSSCLPPTPTTTCEGGNEYEGGGGAFRRAWDEAHEAFRERAKTREKLVIDV
jgi:hypothetical protein